MQGGTTMQGKEVIVYVSDNCKECDRVKEYLELLGADYKLKNVTEERNFLKELQTRHIYATPATIINGEVILGFQKQKIENELYDLSIK